VPGEREQVVVNLRPQAVELHLAGRVVVVPPLGEVTVRTDDDRVLGQVEALRRRRLVAVRQPPARKAPAKKTARARKAGS
jgi:hypothetical protein